MRRVPLFARCLAIPLQDRLYERNGSRQLWSQTSRNFPLRRHRISYGFPHHPPVHSQLPRYSFDCAGAVFIFPPDLFI